MAESSVERACQTTITQAEFLRLLPAAVDGATFKAAGGIISHGHDQRGWRITLTPLPDLTHGLIRLERQRVVFAFCGFAASEITAFFRRFDLYFARGGG